MRESETLESQNVDLKTELKKMEEMYHYLTELWRNHQMECKNGNNGNNGNNNNNNGNPMNREQNNNNNSNSEMGLTLNCGLRNDEATIKDSNNNKHLMSQELSQLPSLTPLINCNVSFDSFY